MSLELARRLVVGLSGPAVTPVEAAWLAHYQPAGVILFSRNCHDYEQLCRLCGHLNTLVPGLEIMADHEGGPVSQLARALSRPPVVRSLGQLDDLALTARVHAETGRRLRAAGVTRVLAPVADVLTEAHNPAIGARAFGSDAKLVERHTVAAVKGLLEEGILVCLKHWPGHGGSRTDTHLTGAFAGEGAVSAPFAAGLTAGADAIMVGHLTTSPNAELPATLDAEFLRESVGQLQSSSGCRPRLIADDITMGGLRGAMLERGIDPGDGEATGMIDPVDLPLAWMSVLVDAGCEQLLIRGLPLGAMPVPTNDRGATTESAGECPVETRFHDEAYRETRQRCWAVAAPEFAVPTAEMLWWDQTVGDRWQVAGGDQGTAQEQLGPLLDPRFAAVHDWEAVLPAASGITRLLVTSHRPLSASGQRDNRLAEQGVCLVMGHPSLAGDLGAYLGTGWRVGAIYDVSPEDLFPMG